MKINVTCVQMEPIRFDVAANLNKMKHFIEKAMIENPKTNLLLFPELITSGYECGKEFQNLAERVSEGESIKVVSGLANKYNVHIIYGFPERDELIDDIIYNASVCIDNYGKVLGTYRKVHLFDTEKEFFKAGSDYPIFDTEIGKIGMMICWDTAFPEVARTYALQGAELIAVSTNWEKPYLEDVETNNQDDWDLVTRARAFDNCLYLAAANRIGFDETLGFFGGSKIIGPTGTPMIELNEEIEGIISAELDYSRIPLLRSAYYTFFEDRRPDTYGIITKKEIKAVQEVIVPAGKGASVEVKAGQYLTVRDMNGGQIADFYAFVLPDKKEFLSMSHTRFHLGRFYLIEEDVLFTNHHRPIMKLVEDTCRIHDMSYSACNQGYYGIRYGIGHQVPNCKSTIVAEVKSYGIEEWQVKDPLDLFQYSPGMVSMVGKNSPGSFVTFEFLLDALVAVSSCPEFEITLGIPATPIQLILSNNHDELKNNLERG